MYRAYNIIFPLRLIRALIEYYETHYAVICAMSTNRAAYAYAETHKLQLGVCNVLDYAPQIASISRKRDWIKLLARSSSHRGGRGSAYWAPVASLSNEDMSVQESVKVRITIMRQILHNAPPRPKGIRGWWNDLILKFS